MRIDANGLKEFPEIMNKEQLCKVCLPIFVTLPGITTV